MKICFLDNNPIGYSANDLNSETIRGAENAIINLASNLASLDNDVLVFNNIDKKLLINNVIWSNLKELNNKEYYFDIAITNNDIRLLDNVNSKKKIAISHSIQPIEKFLRKGQLKSYLKNKPKMILLGKYHDSKRNYLLKIFGKEIVEWGVDESLINHKMIDSIKENTAIFTSRSDRNLDIAIEVWKKYVFSNNNKFKFNITPISQDLSKYNIFNRRLESKNHMISDLSNSKICIIPGHKAELYCIAAEEAKELCIPIVTLGTGSLSERIEHGVSGLIAKNNKEFGNYIINLFNDNRIYNTIRNNLKNNRGSKNWKKLSKNFLQAIIK